MNLTSTSLADEVRTLLIQSLTEVFGTMFTLEVKPAAPHDFCASGQPLVAGSVGFIGDVNGIVYIQVTAAFGRTLASRMLGLPETELDGDDMINDVIGELSNMIVGSVKSHLCDAGTPCVLTIPSVMRGQRFTIEPLRFSERRLLSFRSADDYIQVELLLKPSE